MDSGNKHIGSGTKRSATFSPCEFEGHWSTWEDGPPPEWVQEHREMQLATYFKSKGSAAR